MRKLILTCTAALGFLGSYASVFNYPGDLQPNNAVFKMETTLNSSMYLFNQVTLPFSENFDGTTHGFTLINGTNVNKWVVGSATSSSPANSMYISNDNANTYSYGASSTVVHAFVQTTIPTTAVDMNLSFDFKCYGESTYDKVRVWLVPNSFTPTAGTAISAANSGGVLISVPQNLIGTPLANAVGNLNGTTFSLGANFQTSYQNLNFIFPAGTFVGQNVKLVFEWSNDTSVQNNPPASIDNVIFKVLSCPQPTNVQVNNVTTDSATVTWTPMGTETQWEVIIQDTAASPPNENSTGVVVTTPGTHTFTNLATSTQYAAFVRAICSTDDKSHWSGPLVFYTTQVPADLPYSENFDEHNPPLTLINGNLTNKWMLGTATSLSPNHSVYISNNNNANAYSNANTNVFFYRDLNVPAGVVDLAIEFDWKGVGNSSDFMRVWLAPTSFNPVPGTAITAGNGVSLVATNFYGQTNWTHAVNAVNAQALAGGTARLIFEFVCNASTLNQTPPAVDNIYVEPITCPQPVNLNVTKNTQGQMVITWTPTGNETQWQLVIQAHNEGYPDGTETIVTVNGNPSYAFNATQGMMYEVYVRAYCSENDQSLWTGPESFSDFNPPACADLEILPLDLNVNSSGEYIICEGENVNVQLNAAFDDQNFKATTSYSVDQIDYAPPFPFLGGTVMPITSDDDYTASFDLPFNFCFYGQEYSYCRIGDNGVVTFGMPYTTTYGEFCPYTLNGPIPSTSFSVKNSIFGVFHDMHTTNNPGENTQINYQVLGTYPCRALVVNYNEVPTWSSSCSSEIYRTTTQIVLYEITNIIEVYVHKRNPCTGSTSNGQGVLGLINADGTQAITPPGRNTGTWSAQNEAWRFTPSGETSVDFAWYANGVEIGTDPVMDYTINETTHFEAVISYPGCGGEDLELRKPFTVRISEQIILPHDIDDVIVCEYEGITTKVDLNQLKGDILQNITEPSDFNVNFYHSQADAEADTNAIASPSTYTPQSLPETIHVRVESLETGCYELTSFRILPGEVPVMEVPADVQICTSYELPALPDAKFTYHEIVSKDMATGFPIQTMNNVPAGTILPIGDYEITIRLESKDGCEKFITYNALIVACDLPYGISPNNDGLNDNLDLTYYRTMSLKIYNRYGKEVYSHGLGYTNQWEGQDNNGNELPSGTYYIDLITPFEHFTQWIQLSRESK